MQLKVEDNETEPVVDWDFNLYFFLINFFGDLKDGGSLCIIGGSVTH